MTTQKKKNLKDQYQVADLREYDVLCTHTTAYPMRRAVMGKQWSEKLGSKRMSKSTPPSPVEKISTSEISCLLGVPDVVSIQYQEGDKPDAGARNVSLQVSLPAYQNITDETVIEEQSLGSKKGSKEQGAPEQMPERSYMGY